MYSVDSIGSIDGVLLFVKSRFFVFFFDGIASVFQEAVYYTPCVESVEMCSGQDSLNFAHLSWYGRGTWSEEVDVMLGARIAALRRDAKLSQAELASRLGISASAMGM